MIRCVCPKEVWICGCRVGVRRLGAVRPVQGRGDGVECDVGDRGAGMEEGILR